MGKRRLEKKETHGGKQEARYINCQLVSDIIGYEKSIAELKMGTGLPVCLSKVHQCKTEKTEYFKSGGISISTKNKNAVTNDKKTNVNKMLSSLDQAQLNGPRQSGKLSCGYMKRNSKCFMETITTPSYLDPSQHAQHSPNI